MSLLRPHQPFLAARELDDPDVVIFGVPLDLTESFRKGTGEAPARIRAVSDVLETYSPALDADLAEIALADWGDLPTSGLDMGQVLEQVAATVKDIGQRALPIMIGGEHTVTVGGVRGISSIHPDLLVMQLDAHADLRDEYQGWHFSHATVMRRVIDELGPASLVQLGIRSGTREELTLASHCLWSSPNVRLGPELLSQIRSRPIYLTIDIDVLDPSVAPGTGCPEPGGVGFDEVLSVIYGLEGANVVAIDVTEVLPAVDVNDITSAAAAKIVRETALTFGVRLANSA